VKARVVVSSRARADIDAVLDDLEIRAGVRVAADYVASLKALYLRLGSFPEAGAVRPALGRYARISLLLPYVVIYRYSANSGVVEIVRILHGSRRISRKLLRAK
jgi:toxin ParE1/3/4